MVRLENASQSGITVRVEPDATVEGAFKMESDDPAAAWPTTIVVLASLALENDASMANSAVAEGRPGGRFALRNVRGPRLLRCGYSLASGSRWWPSKVLLDGADVTNVPTDFSRTPHARLEVVFTQHPAWLRVVVRDPQGRPVPGAWVTLLSANKELWHRWATTTQAVQVDQKGGCARPLAPGGYLVNVFAPRTFRRRDEALEDLGRLAAGATPVTLGERESKTSVFTTGGSSPVESPVTRGSTSPVSR